MSTHDVTVSLSRLALAKAIKTPDAGEKDAEPWSKSIIFHQSHIDSNMINSIVNPQQQNKYRGNGRNQKPQGRYPQQPLLQQQQQQHPQQQQRRPNPPLMNRTRSDDSNMYNNQTPSQTRFQPPQQNKSNVRSSGQSTSSGSNNGASYSSSKLANNPKQRRIVPSDDEEEESEEEDSEEEDQLSPMKSSQPSLVLNLKQNISANSLPSKAPVKDKGKAPSRIPQPSDDEDSSEEEEEDSSDEQKEVQPQKTNYLTQEKASYIAQDRSNMTSSDQPLFTQRTTTHKLPELHDTPLQHKPSVEIESSTIDQWRTMFESDEVKSTPTLNGSVVTPVTEEEEDDVIEEPIVSTLPLPLPRDRTSAYDMDSMYFQQQRAYNTMQMQQAMQMQMQQAQMAQIQQYQQLQMQQQYQQQMQSSSERKANNRKSVSAMDLMLQLEQEKAAMRKNKKKTIDPSKAHLADGLLGIVPEQGQHNVNFQHMSMKPNNNNRKQRTSKLEYNMQDKRHTSSRPKSTLMFYDQRQMADPRMLAPMNQPIPTLSMSTPPPMMTPPPQQYLNPMMMNTQQMMPSMSTTRTSVNMQPSKRQSNYGGYHRHS